MQIKNLIIRNSVSLVDETKEVIKVVETPFAPFTRVWCSHEAQCLSKLAELGFAGAPRLICASENHLTMQMLDGRSLNGHPVIDEEMFRRVLGVVHRLHDLGFAHGNLRPSNIRITDEGEVALIDFETCCQKGNPLFFLARFSDLVRLHLLWKSTVAPFVPTPEVMFFQKRVILAMYIISPLNRCTRSLRAIKKRIRRSLKIRAERRASRFYRVTRGLRTRIRKRTLWSSPMTADED
jgi:predicted Ser/Thr protein kinase